MALQGTIETFALPEVLRLLGSGGKTGRLRVSGDRGSGSVWTDGGKVVGAEATGAREGASPVSVVFELLRFAEGSFNFDDDTTNTEPSTPQDIEVLLGDAERQLSEWREVEAVVPSLAVGLTFAAELPTAEVVVDAKRWTALVAVADGRSVAAIADALDLDELAACRRAKELIEAGLVELTEYAVATEPEPVADMVDDPDPAPVPERDAALVSEPDPVAEVGEMWAAAEDAPSGGGFDLVGSAPMEAEPDTYGAAERVSYDTGFAADSGFAAEAVPSPGPDSRSSARAELDAMASGFGLQDEGPAHAGFSPEGEFTTDGSFSTGDFSTGGDFSSGGDFGGGDFGGAAFEHGFASDPGDDPAFSFAAPGGAGTEFDGLGGTPGDSAFESGAGSSGGAALFADDVVTAAPPASGLNGSDGLFAAGTSDFDDPADDSGDAAEVARQLTNLSPKAARAVAAAARAATVEEREAALAEVTSDGDEPINRGLLLKFLSSVQT